MPIGSDLFVFWDVGGQVGLRSIWDHYYGEADGLAFVIDATDRERLEEVREVMG